MKSTMTDQDLIDASAPALRGKRHGMRPEHFAQPMLDSMRAIADAAVVKSSEAADELRGMVTPGAETIANLRAENARLKNALALADALRNAERKLPL